VASFVDADTRGAGGADGVVAPWSLNGCVVGVDELTGTVGLGRDAKKAEDARQLLAAKRGVADMPGPAQRELDDSIEYSLVSTLVWGVQSCVSGSHQQSGRAADEPTFTKGMVRPPAPASTDKNSKQHGGGGSRSGSPSRPRSKSPAGGGGRRSRSQSPTAKAKAAQLKAAAQQKAAGPAESAALVRVNHGVKPPGIDLWRDGEEFAEGRRAAGRAESYDKVEWIAVPKGKGCADGSSKSVEALRVLDVVERIGGCVELSDGTLLENPARAQTRMAEVKQFR
jgi:hypothetical protein